MKGIPEQGRAEDPFRRMELAEGGPLGKPLHGNGSRRSFFIFKAAIEKRRFYYRLSTSGVYLTVHGMTGSTEIFIH
ncbi:hypothetical protein C6Y45_06940 [Alkalicoccus saliphilus]|uniref:Uncharacterized protein n=1 Tax=Alkalicoccus saliphilus TaxID=200989 RepID=A0A2T4U7J8_9BACI|nr:hypothetical protein C6Y45_06940 [Alkalicoccus saliphilus]